MKQRFTAYKKTYVKMVLVNEERIKKEIRMENNIKKYKKIIKIIVKMKK